LSDRIACERPRCPVPAAPPRAASWPLGRWVDAKVAAPVVMTDKERARRTQAEIREGEAMQRLARIRWPDRFRCPKCRLVRFQLLRRRGWWLCRVCRYQCSVTAGTILHRSRVPSSKWVAAVELLGRRFVEFTAPQLQQERQRAGFLEVTPWTVQKKLQLGSFDTAVRIVRLFEQAVMAMPLAQFGGLRRITLNDFFQALLRPVTDAPPVVKRHRFRKWPKRIVARSKKVSVVRKSLR
jgi:hypothetical protein